MTRILRTVYAPLSASEDARNYSVATNFSRKNTCCNTLPIQFIGPLDDFDHEKT